MNFFSRIFGKKLVSQNDEPQPSDKTTNQKFERRMKEDFGLEYNLKGSLYNGYCDEQFYNELSSAKDCLGFIKGIKMNLIEKKMNITQMCIVVDNSFTLLIFNTKPRIMTMKISLSSQEAAKLMADIVMINNKQILEYKGSFLVSLERL